MGFKAWGLRNSRFSNWGHVFLGASVKDVSVHGLAPPRHIIHLVGGTRWMDVELGFLGLW